MCVCVYACVCMRVCGAPVCVYMCVCLSAVSTLLFEYLSSIMF